jgi:hypothetical protein
LPDGFKKINKEGNAVVERKYTITPPFAGITLIRFYGYFSVVALSLRSTLRGSGHRHPGNSENES